MKADRRAIADMAATFEHDTVHSRQVAKVAEQLFDACQDLHGLGKDERELLVYAALLHDIGWSVGQQKHHKRACDFIISRGIEGLSKRETSMVANIARYHRKALPSLSHPEFAQLSPSDREIVRKLSALIRIADGLDATHQSLSTVTACKCQKDTTMITLTAAQDPTYELDSATEKSDLFEEVFGRKIEFKVMSDK